MKTLVLYISFFLALSCNNSTKQDLEEFAHNAFFKADLDQSFEKLLEYFKSQKNLSFAEPEGGYTLYPPLSALVDTNLRFRFSFETHPYLSALNTKGQLVLHRLGPALSEPELLYYFKSQENALSFIESITEDIHEQPIVNDSTEKDKSRQIYYKTNKDANILINLTPGLSPGCTVSIKYRHQA